MPPTKGRKYLSVAPPVTPSPPQSRQRRLANYNGIPPNPPPAIRYHPYGYNPNQPPPPREPTPLPSALSLEPTYLSLADHLSASFDHSFETPPPPANSPTPSSSVACLAYDLPIYGRHDFDQDLVQRHIRIELAGAVRATNLGIGNVYTALLRVIVPEPFDQNGNPATRSLMMVPPPTLLARLVNPIPVLHENTVKQDGTVKQEQSQPAPRPLHYTANPIASSRVYQGPTFTNSMTAAFETVHVWSGTYSSNLSWATERREPNVVQPRAAIIVASPFDVSAMYLRHREAAPSGGMDLGSMHLSASRAVHSERCIRARESVALAIGHAAVLKQWTGHGMATGVVGARFARTIALSNTVVAIELAHTAPFAAFTIVNVLSQVFNDNLHDRLPHSFSTLPDSATSFLCGQPLLPGNTHFQQVINPTSLQRFLNLFAAAHAVAEVGAGTGFGTSAKPIHDAILTAAANHLPPGYYFPDTKPRGDWAAVWALELAGIVVCEVPPALFDVLLVEATGARQDQNLSVPLHFAPTQPTSFHPIPQRTDRDPAVGPHITNPPPSFNHSPETEYMSMDHRASTDTLASMPSSNRSPLFTEPESEAAVPHPAVDALAHPGPHSIKLFINPLTGRASVFPGTGSAGPSSALPSTAPAGASTVADEALYALALPTPPPNASSSTSTRAKANGSRKATTSTKANTSTSSGAADAPGKKHIGQPKSPAVLNEDPSPAEPEALAEGEGEAKPKVVKAETATATGTASKITKPTSKKVTKGAAKPSTKTTSITSTKATSKTIAKASTKTAAKTASLAPFATTSAAAPATALSAADAEAGQDEEFDASVDLDYLTSQPENPNALARATPSGARLLRPPAIPSSSPFSASESFATADPMLTTPPSRAFRAMINNSVTRYEWDETESEEEY